MEAWLLLRKMLGNDRYPTSSPLGVTRPSKLKDYFLFQDNDSEEKFTNDLFF